MSLEEDILIQKFVRNELSERDRKEILLKMKEDHSFHEKVKFENQLFLNFNSKEWNAIENNDSHEVKAYEVLFREKASQDLKETLSKVNERYQNSQKSTAKFWWLSASVAIILILLGTTLFLSRKTHSQELYANYLDLSDVPSLVDRGSNDSRLLIKAQRLFDAKEYEKALQIFINNYKNPEQNKSAIYLYTGIAQMELNKYKEAEKTFDQLYKSDLLDAPKGIWYKALLFIKKNDISKAKEILLIISNSKNHYKKKEARNLLKML